MARTPMQDPNSGEARSAWIAGLTEIANKLCGVLNMQTATFEDLPLIDSDDRRRYFDAPLGNKLWLDTPAPVIKLNGEVITQENDHFEIDLLGGAVTFEVDHELAEGDVLTASATYIVDESEVLTDLLKDVAIMQASNNKLVGIFANKNELTNEYPTAEVGNFAIVESDFLGDTYVFRSQTIIYYWAQSGSNGEWKAVHQNVFDRLMAWGYTGIEYLSDRKFLPSPNSTFSQWLSVIMSLVGDNIMFSGYGTPPSAQDLIDSVGYDTYTTYGLSPGRLYVDYESGRVYSYAGNEKWRPLMASFTGEGEPSGEIPACVGDDYTDTTTFDKYYCISYDGGYTKEWKKYADDTAKNTADSAYIRANNAYAQANNAYNKANSASTTATSAYAQANNAYNAANSAASTATSAYAQANQAYNQANAAATTAASAYTQANNAYNAANSASTIATTANNMAKWIRVGTTGTAPSQPLGYGVAVGNGGSANASTGDVAIGLFGFANAYGAVNSIAVGRNVYTNAKSGTNAYANSSIAIAIGTHTYANTNANGYNARACCYGSIAIGIYTYVNANANGYNARADGHSSIAIGYNASAISYTNGNYSSCECVYPIAIGINSNSSGVASGSNATSTATGTISIGSGAQANASSTSYTTGNNSRAFSSGAIAIGWLARAHSSASGNNSAAYSTGAIAIGYNASVYAYSEGGTINSSGAIAIGQHSSAHYNAYSTAIGYYAIVNAANKFQLGNASTLSTLSCRVSLTVTSDARDKADIADIGDGATDFLRKIRVVKYVLNEREKYQADEEEITTTDENGEEHTEMVRKEIPEEDRATTRCYDYNKTEHAKGTKKGKRVRAGVLAQNVQEAMTEVYGAPDYTKLIDDDCYDYPEVADNVEHHLTVSYEEFVPYLIKSIQELDNRLTNVEQRLTTVEDML